MTTTTPIYFRLRKNSKRPVDCFTKVTKSKNVDMTSFNKGLRTGYVSNITAVDLDLYNGGNSTDFVNKFGEDYVENLIQHADPEDPQRWSAFALPVRGRCAADSNGSH